MPLYARIVSSPSLRLLFICATILGLAACESPPPRSFPELTFVHLAPIRLNVATVEVVSEYNAPLKEPNVEHLFTASPGATAQRWAQDRLRAGGASGAAKFIVKEASVIETRLKKSGGLTGLLTTDQEARYEGTLEALIEVRNDRGWRQAFATVRVVHTRTAPEGLTLSEREQIWFEMTEKMLADFNTELEANIEAHLDRFVM